MELVGAAPGLGDVATRRHPRKGGPPMTRVGRPGSAVTAAALGRVLPFCLISRIAPEGDMTEPVDYQAVLADLKARRSRLDTVIAGIEAVMLMGSADVSLPSGPDLPVAGGDSLPVTIHAD